MIAKKIKNMLMSYSEVVYYSEHVSPFNSFAAITYELAKNQLRKNMRDNLSQIDCDNDTAYVHEFDLLNIGDAFNFFSKITGIKYTLVLH